MEIIVYTKLGCKLCASFKDKLSNHLKVLFAERDLQRSLQVSDTWRENGTDKLIAAHGYVDGAVPLILIDGCPYKYAAALAEIKRRLGAGEEATVPEPERDKSADMLGPQLTEEEFVAAVWRLCANHNDMLVITSLVERTYDGVGKPPVRYEAQGDIQICIHYRDPTVKPMSVELFEAQGQDFRKTLRNLRDTLEDAKQKGFIL